MPGLDLDRIESIARSFDGGLGDQSLLGLVKQARRGDHQALRSIELHVEMMQLMPVDPDRTANMRARRPTPSLLDTQRRPASSSPYTHPRPLLGEEPWEIAVALRTDPTHVDLYDQIALGQWLIDHAEHIHRALATP